MRRDRRRGHTPFLQAGTETSDTGAETVKPEPGWCCYSRTSRVVFEWLAFDLPKAFRQLDTLERRSTFSLK